MSGPVFGQIESDRHISNRYGTIRPLTGTKLTSILYVSKCSYRPLLMLLFTFRCGHNDPKRPLFNWGHFFVAVVAYICAMIAFIVAATEFKKLWEDSVLQTVLVIIPGLLLLFLWPLTQIWLPKKEEEDDEKETVGFYTFLLKQLNWYILKD